MKITGEIMEARKHHGNICFINMWYDVSIFFSANVRSLDRPTGCNRQVSSERKGGHGGGLRAAAENPVCEQFIFHSE